MPPPGPVVAEMELTSSGLRISFVTDCGWCRGRDHLVPVAVVDVMRSAYACRGCVEEYRIIPLDEHPRDSKGVTVLYRADEQASPPDGPGLRAV